jgi:Zn-dependent peptidase ImmA (M78 family)
MNWQIANATAMMRAPQIHRDLGLNRSGYVDVFTALQTAGIDCNAQHLPKLFGFYFAPEQDGPAILLNASLDEAGLRHTAAHELGHHVFGHGSQADTDLDLAGLQPHRVWTAVEKQAESFAAWFLMPPPAVDAAMKLVGVQEVLLPEQAYEIARWLGTSYAGTVRHLRRLKKIPPKAAAAWPRIPPQRLRARLHRSSLARPRSHMFVVRPSAGGGVLHIAVGDVVLLPPGARVPELPEGIVAGDPVAASSDDEPDLFDPASGLCPRLEVTDKFRRSSTLHVITPGQEPISVTVVAPVRRRGVADAWGGFGDEDSDDPDEE